MFYAFLVVVGMMVYITASRIKKSRKMAAEESKYTVSGMAIPRGIYYFYFVISAFAVVLVIIELISPQEMAFENIGLALIFLVMTGVQVVNMPYKYYMNEDGFFIINYFDYVNRHVGWSHFDGGHIKKNGKIHLNLKSDQRYARIIWKLDRNETEMLNYLKKKMTIKE